MVLLALLLVLQLPDPLKTPGAIRPLTQTQVCATRWGLDRRHVTVTMRRQVARAYGVSWPLRARYEFDHLVPRELGGADSVPNLWPQRRAGPWNSRIKDGLENSLHRAVCRGDLSLKDAQTMFLTDWTASYGRWFHDR